MSYKLRVLLGALGDDIHIVGIKLIQQTLVDSGYHVTFMGIQNGLEQFFEQAADHEIILVSSLNGHSYLYLQEFERFKQVYSERYHGEEKLWYLGGNIAMSEDPVEVERRYIKSGFTRVFAKPVGVDVILEALLQDVNIYNIKPHHVPSRMLESRVVIDKKARFVKDNSFDESLFEIERELILSRWKTGKDVRECNVKSVHSRLQSLPKVLYDAKVNNKFPLIQPRTGVAGLEDQERLFRKLKGNPVDISSIQLDAASRVNNFEAAEKYMLESLNNKSLLNGFPVPVHGPAGLNRIINVLELPFQVRGGGPDHRFVYEVSVAGGASGVEGGFLCYLFPYNKDMAPSVSLEYWKYVDNMCAGYYRQLGILINREYFGTLTATLIEPSIPIVINVVQAVISARNGVRSITVGYAEQGNRLQDIASMKVMEKMTNRYLRKNGFNTCQVTTVFHQYMAAFPKSEQRSEQLIKESAITAALAKATKIMTKTPVESIKIPSVEENIRGVNIVAGAWQLAGDVKIDQQALKDEMDLIETEVTCIMDAIEDLGKGEYSKGILLAFEFGIIDIPFCPNMHSRGEVLTFRAINGAVRFASCTNFPFPEEIKAFHASELEIRKLYDGTSKISALIATDVTRVWNEDYKKWPLDVESLS